MPGKSNIKLVSVRCPDCGAALDIESGREQAFCTYCGAKVIISNENEKVYKHVNAAAVKRAEAKRDVRLRELELFEDQLKRDAEEQKRSAPVYICLIIAILIGFICLLYFTTH